MTTKTPILWPACCEDCGWHGPSDQLGTDLCADGDPEILCPVCGGIDIVEFQDRRDGWVRPSERLPGPVVAAAGDEIVCVIACHKSGVVSEALYVANAAADARWNMFGVDVPDADVLAWQPMPPPPAWWGKARLVAEESEIAA